MKKKMYVTPTLDIIQLVGGSVMLSGSSPQDGFDKGDGDYNTPELAPEQRPTNDWGKIW